MAVVATGGSPTITFGAPSLNAPAGASGATTQVRYTSLGGASQAYTSSASTSNASALLDIYTVNGRVQRTGGFPSGSYTVTTVVTCSQ